MTSGLLPNESGNRSVEDLYPLILTPESLVLPIIRQEDLASITDPTRTFEIWILGFCTLLTALVPVIQFSAGRADRLCGVLLNSPVLEALRTSRQWGWERQTDAASPSPEKRTSCIIAVVPNNNELDITFIMRVGNRAGWEIVKYMDFSSSSQGGDV